MMEGGEEGKVFDPRPGDVYEKQGSCTHEGAASSSSLIRAWLLLFTAAAAGWVV